MSGSLGRAVRPLSLPDLTASPRLRLGQTTERVDLFPGAVVTGRHEHESSGTFADGHQRLLTDLDAVRSAVLESNDGTYDDETTHETLWSRRCAEELYDQFRLNENQVIMLRACLFSGMIEGRSNFDNILQGLV